jgi:hypothetical protein
VNQWHASGPRPDGNPTEALPPARMEPVMKGLYISVAAAAEVNEYERAANTLDGNAFRRVCAARFLLGDEHVEAQGLIR